MKATSPEAVGFSVRDGKGRDIKLAMQELWLTGEVLPVGARLLVRHVFQSDEKQPVEVVYTFVLPRDAALRQFRIEGKNVKVTSELRTVEAAQKLYEKGIEQGSLSTLAKQYGDGLINLSVGNLLPGEQVTVFLEVMAGVELRDDGYRFRFPFTLSPTYHPKGRTVEVGPGVGEMELPDNQFGDLILPPFHKDATSLHRVGFDLAISCPNGPVTVASPSHTLRVGAYEVDRVQASIARESDVPNRDLVLDVTTKNVGPVVFASSHANRKGQFAAVIPSTAFGQGEPMPRRIVFALDRSGSMEGDAIQQAKNAVKTCLASLSPADFFGLVAFNNGVEVLGDKLLKGDAQSREQAVAFLDRIDASGGTEIFSALDQGAKLLGEDGGDMFVVTDGQVSATEQIIAKTKSLGIRIHVLGIGSASQDRFLTLLARDSGGLSRFLTAQERVDMAAVELFASAGTPLARRLSFRTEGLGTVIVAPEIPQTVFAGSPLILFGETGGTGTGKLILTWQEPKSGSVEVQLVVPKKRADIAETLYLLRGSRLITDADTQLTGEEAASPAAMREQKRGTKKIEDLSRKYGLASRGMALVAVVARETDVKGQVPKTLVVPVGMLEGTRFGAYFSSAHLSIACSPSLPLANEMAVMGYSSPPQRRSKAAPLRERVTDAATGPADTVVLLLELAARLEPDGGMPGKSEEERIAATLLALIFFASNGHSTQQGTLRAHAQRLIQYLSHSSLLTNLMQIRDLTQDCIHRLEGVGRLVNMSVPLSGRKETAELCARSQHAVVQLADSAVRTAGRIDSLLTNIGKGNMPPGDHSAMVRDLIATGRVDAAAVWKMADATI